MTSTPIAPRISDQVERAALDALEAAYRALRGRAQRDAFVDALILTRDEDALAAHQANRVRTGQDPLDTTDTKAVARAVHRANERWHKADRRRLRPLEAAEAPRHAGDDTGAPPATSEIRDAGCVEPDAALVVSSRVAELIAITQKLCDAIDGAAAELSDGRRSGLKRIRRVWRRANGRPRGAGPGTPAAALRHLLRAQGGSP